MSILRTFPQIKYTILVFTIFYINSSLFSESYSSYRLDDSLYFTGGRKAISIHPRVDPRLSLKEDTSGWNLDPIIYANGSYRSQKGGESQDKESRYESQGSLDPEFQLYYSDLWIRPFLLVAPMVKLREESRLERERSTIYDGEALVGVDMNVWGVNSFIQGGRGFYRLDQYGLIFAGRMNFAEWGNSIKVLDGTLGLSLLNGNWNSEIENLTPDRLHNIHRNIAGIRIVGESLFGSLDGNLFYYRTNRKKIDASIEKDFIWGEDFQYLGLELKYFWQNTGVSIEGAGFNMYGFRDKYRNLVYQLDDKIVQSSNLFYGSIGWSNGYSDVSIGGLYRDRNGFESLGSTPRILGGDGSILMGFRENVKELTYSSPRLELYGVSGFQKFSILEESGFCVGALLNISSSDYGRGREAILRMGWLEDGNSENGNDFVHLTFAYAWIQPAGMESKWIDEVRTKPVEKEYFKIFLSSGLVF